MRRRSSLVSIARSGMMLQLVGAAMLSIPERCRRDRDRRRESHGESGAATVTKHYNLDHLIQGDGRDRPPETIKDDDGEKCGDAAFCSFATRDRPWRASSAMHNRGRTLPPPAYEITAPPDGVIQNQYTSATTNYPNNGQPMGGWGCVNDAEPEYVDGCPSEENQYNDWVFYQIPAVCEVQVQVTIYSGNTIVLQEACETLYPAVVTDTILDMAPPVTYSDNVRLPFDPTDG
ncbi:hypothetical protein THAOC_16671, partial [Thalassiosira oceanica]